MDSFNYERVDPHVGGRENSLRKKIIVKKNNDP